jgi:nucleoside-diphosphate-sugar epimerase
MTFLRLVASRLARGWSVSSLGPNEARVVFDLAIGSAGLIATILFERFSDGGLPANSWLLATLPVVFLAANFASGLYTWLKRARSRVKALVLVGTVIASCLIATLLGAPTSGALLWGMLVVGPATIARLLLGLPYSKHSALVTTLVVHPHGPVVVLGGAGYIGSHTVDLLLERGYQVRVLDRLMYGRQSLADFVDRPGFEVIDGDVTDITKLTSALRNASAVIHLAGLVGDPACAVDDDFTRHTNIIATRMAKEVAQSLGVYRFVFASSCSVYGISDEECGEHSRPNPISLYARTKVDSERELLGGGRDDFFVTVLRFATVFGHSRRPRFDLVANLFTAQAMTEGVIRVVGPDQWRPFVHVRDLARAVLAVLEAPPAIVQDQIFNVGDKRFNMTIGQLAELVERVAGEYQPGVTRTVQEQANQDRRNYAVSFEKIRRQLRFEATIGMEDGIREMARQFADGAYRHYGDEVYSNLATTRRALEYFHDPFEAQRMYGPRKAS